MTGSRLFEEEQSPRRDRDNSAALLMTRPGQARYEEKQVMMNSDGEPQLGGWERGNNLDIIGREGEGGGGLVSRKLRFFLAEI